MTELNSLYGVREGDLYTSDRNDVWKVEWKCEAGLPILVLVNVRTGEIRGDNGEFLNLRGFHRLCACDNNSTTRH